MRNRKIQIVFIVLIVAAMAAGAMTLAKGKPTGPKPCKYALIMCLDVWNPVVCSDGKVYSNACYAKRACATGCVPADGGPVLWRQ